VRPGHTRDTFIADVTAVLDPQVHTLARGVQRHPGDVPGRLQPEDGFEERGVLHAAVLRHRAARRKAGEQAGHPPSGPRSRPELPTPVPEGPLQKEEDYLAVRFSTSDTIRLAQSRTVNTAL
jgi:hypothetical protein